MACRTDQNQSSGRAVPGRAEAGGLCAGIAVACRKSADKTFSLLLDPLHYINTYKKFGGVIFRRTTPQIKAEGGLWDTSMDLYNHVNARPRESEREWVFNFGNKI